jgi:V8-like Glu-specific endopeptidase
MTEEAQAPPLTVEEALTLPDEPARAMPSEIRSSLATQRLYLSSTDDIPLDPKPHRVHEGWSLPLPENAALGLPGRTQTRTDRSTVELDDVGSTEPHRPEWISFSAQPRPALPFRHPRISRVDGTLLEPFYGVYAPDDRQVYYPNTYPWTLTGRIFTYTSWPSPNWAWSGSGVLVGPRHVLTAGHVIPWNSPNWAMLFVPGYWNGASALGAGASSYVSDSHGWNTNNTVAAHDMAVVRLYEPLGNQLGWMGTKTYDSGWQGGNYWTITGYPGAIAAAERPSYQSGIPVLDDDNDGDAKELEHHGDVTEGDSGGPIFGIWGTTPYAIGTTSGGETISGGIFGIGDEDNNIEAGGKAMVDLVQWALNNWQ